MNEAIDLMTDAISDIYQYMHSDCYLDAPKYASCALAIIALKEKIRIEKDPAHWIPSSDGDGIICSECGTDYCTMVCDVYKIKYCPNCGKRIERSGNNE